MEPHLSEDQANRKYPTTSYQNPRIEWTYIYREIICIKFAITLKRLLRGDLIEFFKIMKGKTDLKWHNPPREIKLDRESKYHNQRIERQLTKVRTTKYDFLPNRIANYWNSLKQSTMDSTDTNKFKSAIDESFFNY